MKKIFMIFCIYILSANISSAQWIQLGGSTDTYNRFTTLVTDTSGTLFGERYNGIVSKWDGANWIDLGNPGGVNEISAGTITTDISGNVYATGATYPAFTWHVYKWDGSTWTELGNGTVTFGSTNATISSIKADSKGNVYVAGCFRNSTSENYVAKWDGTSWTEIGVGANTSFVTGCIDALALDKFDSLYIAGAYNSLTDTYASKWNGTSWTKIGGTTLVTQGRISLLTFDSNHNLYTAGTIKNVGYYPYVAKWDGTVWSQVGVGDNPFNADGQNYQFGSIGINSSDNLFTASCFGGNNPKGYSNCYVESWNGTSWNPFGYNFDYIFQGPLCVDKFDNIYASVLDTNFSAGQQYYIVKNDPTLTGTLQASQEKNILTIFPNPTSSFLTLQLNTENNKAEISLYNVLGEKILQRNISSIKDSATEQLDLSSYPPGTYFISVKTEKENGIQRIIKQD